MAVKLKTASAIAFCATIALPSVAFADLKDDLIRGALGAIIKKGLEQETRQQPKPQPPRTTQPRQVVPQSIFSFSERKQIQSYLNILGHNAGKVDGVLGSGSQRAIRRFQASQGYSQTGSLTRPQFASLQSLASSARTQTTSTFDPSPSPDRSLTRDEVRILQRSLRNLGYYRGSIDGKAGRGTARGVSEFLRGRGRDPYQTSPVEALVLAARASNTSIPSYLVQEASLGGQQTESDIFGGAPQESTQQGDALDIFGTPQPETASVEPSGGVQQPSSDLGGLDVFTLDEGTQQPAQAEPETSGETPVADLFQVGGGQPASSEPLVQEPVVNEEEEEPSGLDIFIIPTQ